MTSYDSFVVVFSGDVRLHQRARARRLAIQIPPSLHVRRARIPPPISSRGFELDVLRIGGRIRRVAPRGGVEVDEEECVRVQDERDAEIMVVVVRIYSRKDNDVRKERRLT